MAIEDLKSGYSKLRGVDTINYTTDYEDLE